MASVFDRYYRALGVASTASERDIKSAYRKLAMRYHPDKNKAPDARARFLEVTEAYQILLKRDEYASILLTALRTTEASRRAAAEARLRKEREEMARANQQYAEMEYAAFMRSPLYRTAMWLNTAYDYVFLAIAIGMVIAPFYSYFYMPIVDEYGNEEHVFHPLALLVGLFFLGGIWYFLFRPQRSKS